MTHVDTGYYWSWFNYSVGSKNAITVLTGSADFYFIVTQQTLSVEMVQVDPGIQYFSPFILPNPWSLHTSFYFQFHGAVLLTNMDYLCNISYNGEFSAVGTVRVISYDQACGVCQFPPTKDHFDLELGGTYETSVTVIPVLRPPLRVSISHLAYWIYNQPILTGISPSHAFSGTNITISGQGFLRQMFIQDYYNHLWQVINADESSFHFELTDLGIPGWQRVCLQVSCNGRDYIPSNCNKTNTFIYLGPKPVPTLTRKG